MPRAAVERQHEEPLDDLVRVRVRVRARAGARAGLGLGLGLGLDPNPNTNPNPNPNPSPNPLDDLVAEGRRVELAHAAHRLARLG